MNFCKRLCLFTLIFALSASAEDTLNLVTADFSQVRQATRTLDPQETLYVVDLDNTLIKTTGDFGSEHWFNWQKSLIEAGVKTLPSVTDSVMNLLQLQGWIYRIGRTVPLSQDFVDYLSLAQARGGATMALTSRMIDSRDATLKDLKLNHISLSTRADLGLKAFVDPELPYDLNHPERAGLNIADVITYKLSAPSESSFEKGVFFTQGAHKGIMLKIFLHASTRCYRNIVFIDDRPHHIEGMRAVFKARPEKLYTFHFTKSAEWINAFNASDKSEAQAAWCALARGVRAAKLADETLPFRDCDN